MSRTLGKAAGDLDSRTVPAAPGVARTGRSRVTANPINAQDGADKPADGAQEGKGDDGLPLSARSSAVEVDAVPVKDIPAAVIQPVNKQAEGDKPGHADDKIDRPVDEGTAEGEQPDDGEQDCEAGDHFGVDEAPEVPRAGALDRMQVVAVEACHDGGKRQLREAQDDGEEVGEDHVGLCCRAISLVIWSVLSWVPLPVLAACK